VRVRREFGDGSGAVADGAVAEAAVLILPVAYKECVIWAWASGRGGMATGVGVGCGGGCVGAAAAAAAAFPVAFAGNFILT
jgi:hypothetical protein